MKVTIPINRVTLEGDLNIPNSASGIVLFAHGSGSSRFSPRNQFVATVIQKAGIATLLFDLLTKEEEEIDIQTAELRFNIPFLAERLSAATDWIKNNPKTKHLTIGYFGSSTGAAAALIAAAQRTDIHAIVSRGGRPDLAIPYLLKVKAPTLLIVGGSDEPVIEMNKEAMKYIKGKTKLEIIPGATHLFEEPGALEKVAQFAADWFKHYLKR